MNDVLPQISVGIMCVQSKYHDDVITLYLRVLGFRVGCYDLL